MAKVAVLGAGSWGSALSIVLADNGHDVRLWTYRKEQAEMINTAHKNEKYLDVPLPKQIRAFYRLEEALKDVSFIVMVVPTKAIRDVCIQMNPYVNPSQTIIHATKGIESGSLKRVSQMIGEELNTYHENDVVVLSGPRNAEEVATGQATTLTGTTVTENRAERDRELFINEHSCVCAR